MKNFLNKIGVHFIPIRVYVGGFYFVIIVIKGCTGYEPVNDTLRSKE